VAIIELSDYEKWKQGQQSRSAAGANVVLGSIDTNPDEVAGDMNLGQDFARTTGSPVPPLPLVTEYRPVFQQAIERSRNATILSSSPMLAEWLKKPENAAVARDDLAGLAAIEGMSRPPAKTTYTSEELARMAPGGRVSDAFQMGSATAVTQGQEFSRDMSAALEGGAVGRGLDATRQAFDDALLTNEDGTPNLLGRLANYARGVAMDSDGVPRQIIGGDEVTLDQRREAILNTELGPMYEGAARLLADMEAQGFSPMSYKDVGGLGGALQFVAENLAMSLPQMGAVTASGALSPLIQLMTLGGEVNSELAERTDLSVEDRVSVAAGAGVVMSALDYFGLSRIFGGIPAGQAVTEAIEGTLVERLVKNGVSEATGRVLQSALTEGVTETLQEAITVGVTALSGGEYTAEEVTERIIQAFTAGSGSGGAMRGGVEGVSGVGNLVRNQTRARDAEDRQTMFQELSGQSVNSRLRARMPDAFRNFVERATENGPVENVFVPADKFVEYFQGIGVDPYEVASGLTGVDADALNVALASGGDLRIPTSTYAADIAGSEHDAFMFENMRFDPDEMTSREAREFNERANDALAEAYEEAERMRREDERFKSFEAEIYDTMVERLRIAGRSTDVATNEAMLYPAFYRVMAERSGLTIEEFMQRYPLPQVRGDLPQGAQARDVDELTRTLAEARSYRGAGPTGQRTPLLEFISNYGGIADRGGELAARDAVEIKRGSGRSTLRLARDVSGDGQASMFGSTNAGRAYGPDDVAQAAIEAGLMADNPVVMEYQAAMRDGRQVPDITAALWAEIDKELRGEASMSADTMRDGVDSADDRILALEEYLSQIGMSLDDSDADIRAAIEADQAERGRMYGQATVPGIPENTIVGPDGNPVRMFHGTNRAFDTFNGNRIFLTSQRGLANEHALREGVRGARLIETNVALANPLEIEIESGAEPDAHWLQNTMAIEAALETGDYDGVMIWNPEGDLMIIATDDAQVTQIPAQGRSYGQGVADIPQPLYVVHNLSETKLGYAVELGGLAAPSLAVARGDIGFENFGEISLIGDPSMADPRGRGVRAFNADVYTPRQPRARFKVTDKNASRVIKVIRGVADDLGFEGRLDTSDLATQGASAISSNVAIKAAWLRDQGETLPVQYRDPDPAPVPVAGYEAFTSTEARELWNDPAFVAQVQAVKEQFVADREGKMGADLLANIKARIFDENGKVTDDNLIDTAQAVARRNAQVASYVPSERGDVDQYRTAVAIDEQIAGREADYSVWVRSQFGDVIGDAYFEDANGRRRDYTMTNLVREMTRGLRDAEGFNYGVGNIRATVAPEFRTVTEMKASRGQIVTSDQADAMKTEVGDEFFALADKFAPYHSSGDSFGWGDIFSEFLKDMGKGRRFVEEWQATIFSEPVPDALLAEAGAFLEKLRGLPTEYFEIKMQRAVGLDEFKVALVPEKASDEAVKTLTDAGLEVLRYGVEGRQAALQRVAGKVFFQQEDTPNLFQEQRGSVQFPAAGVGNGDTVISLFRKADLSTFAHETGHYFLTVMQDMAARGETNAVQEYDTIKTWWRDNAADVAKDAMRVMPDVTVTADDVIAALDNGTTGDTLKDAAIDVGMQEQTARAFEAYLMEGKAPSIALRGVFDKFRAWLMSVYKSLRGLNVTPSDELRAVFDRMLATDAEIAQARSSVSDAGPVFTTAEQMGMTDEQYQAFLKLNEDAKAEAAAKLLNETMAPIRRQAEQWYRDERAKVRAEVERDVNSWRQYRALEWMGNRRWLGEDKPEALADMRLSKDILVERYGAGVLKTLPRGQQTVYAVEGGVDPDVAAGMFGFSSGDEMIKAMERAGPRKEAIEAETDLVMKQRHNDPLTDGSVQELAIEAIHGDKRAQALQAELKALTDIAGSDRGLTRQEAREIARQTLSRTQVRDAIAANRYLAAERKAAEEAQRLAATVTRTQMWTDAARRRVGVTARAGVRDGDTSAPARVADQVDQANARAMRSNEAVQKLVEAKRRQLMNHMLYAEARAIAAEVESAETLARRLQKRSTRDKLAGDYLEAIDEILQRYDFRKVSSKAEDRRGALLAYVDRMTAEGRDNELAIPESVMRDGSRLPYKRLTVEHLRGVVDSLKNIEHTARLKKTLQDAQSQRELDAVVEDIVGAFDKNLPKRPPGRVGTDAERRRQGARGFLDLILNAGTLLREIDGFQDFGPAFRNLKAPIDEAQNRLQGRRQKAAMDLESLYDDVYSRAEQRQMNVREFIPEVQTSMSKFERIAVALNMGNDGNYQRLTDTRVRGGFTEAQVQAIIATLDARDAKFVQSVWDYLETFRPDIEAREKRVTGVAPKWVEPRPVVIAGTTLKGGYFPLRYDPRLSAAARDDQMQDISKSLQAGRFGKAQTRNGHLKERAQSSGRGVELDMATLHKHVQQVVYDLELSEPVANSWRILQDPRVRTAFIDAGKQADFDALEIWLKDVAEGEIRAADFVSRNARRFKSNFTAAKLAFNLSTVAVQLTGVAQSMVVVGKKDFLNGVVSSFRPGVSEEIIAKSQFMSDRQTTFNKDIFDLYNDPKMGPVTSRWTNLRNEWIAPAGLWLMTKVQFYTVDMPTWLAGYQQGLRKFPGDEGKAIAYADDVVKRAQASGIFSDRSAIERGSANMGARQNDLLRLFTTLGSYMFAKFNVAYERTQRARGVIRSEGMNMKSAQEAFSWTLDMAFLFALEAVLYAAIKGRLPDEEDDEDGDGMLDEWAKFVGRETALSIAATIPFVRDVTGPISGFAGGGAYGGITEELARPFQQVGQGEFDRPFVKSIINATGLFTGLPAGQINRAVDAGWRAAEGEDVSAAEYLLGRMGK
jgi:hypothetical protein